MDISEKGIEFIKGWEKLKLKAYRDSKGVLTIGYGHTKGVFEGMTITEDKANEFLYDDLRDAVNAVNHYCAPVLSLLSSEQFDMLVSLVFNAGSGNIFTKVYGNGYKAGSTLYNRLLNGDLQGAGERFTDFVNSGGKFVQGLLNRRNAEKAQFLKKKV